MQLVDPRVSTDCRFFTSTYLPCMRLAVRASEIVTVKIRPSGTLATMMPIAKTMLVRIGYRTIKPRTKKDVPMTEAIIVMKIMNLSISISSVDLWVSDDYARPAMQPITVLSPVLKTIP